MRMQHLSCSGYAANKPRGDAALAQSGYSRSRLDASIREDRRTPRVAGAKHAGEDSITALHFALLAPVVDRERNRGCGRVPVELDRVEDFRRRNLADLDDLLVDPEIRLVRDEPLNVVPRQTRLLQRG